MCIGDPFNVIMNAYGGRIMINIKDYWNATLRQDAQQMRTYFHFDAYIRWHNTNEEFSVDEFIRANCEYPGNWDGEIERMEIIDDLIITVTHVFSTELSFHVTSFIKMEDDKIKCIDEYWGDDGEPPLWRKEKHIGKLIKESAI